MIQGAAGFHFIGLAVRQRCAMLVFREGLLMIDQERPGWGVMPQAELWRLLPGAHDGPSDDEASDDPDTRSSTSFSTDTSNSDSDSGDEPDLPEDWLGWWPAEAPLQVGRVCAEALRAWSRLPRHSPAVAALANDFRAGRLAPATDEPPHKGGVMVELQQFGRPRLLGWRGLWATGGEPTFGHLGLPAELMAALVAGSKLADHCNLADVQATEMSRYVGHVEDASSRVLVFSNGLLVQRHTEPRLVGWHPAGTEGHWGLVSPETAEQLALSCIDATTPHSEQVMNTFRAGGLRLEDGPCFAALVRWTARQRWVPMAVDAPHGLIRPGAPGAPGADEVADALRQARWSALHERQIVGHPMSLGSGRWRVPVMLGALRCLAAATSVPGLLAHRWHDTLQPLIERLLLANRASERAWLDAGVIEQPIDALIDLMRRDRCLRRSEVTVWWPVTMLGDLLKALAPRASARAVALPRPEEVERALTEKAAVMLLFTSPAAEARQCVVSVLHGTVWSEDFEDLDALRERIRKAGDKSAAERLTAMVVID